MTPLAGRTALLASEGSQYARQSQLQTISRYNYIYFSLLSKIFLEAVERYFKELLPKLVPLQRCNKGPIIAFQVENEYGDFPDGEIGHLEWLQELMEKYLTELLFLSDGGHTIRHQNMYKNAAAVCKEVVNFYRET